MNRLHSILQLTFLLVLSLLFSLSCNKEVKKETTNSDSFLNIPFAEIVKNKREVKLSEIATDVEFVQFENTPEALLGNVFDIQLTKDYIFIRHSGSGLLTQFSRKGKFIRHVGSEGRGPKEYALMRNFSIDEKNQQIYIHTNWTHKMLVYNFDGEYIKTLEFQGIGRGHYTWSRDSFLVSFSEPNTGNEPYVFIETNFNGDTIQTIRNHLLWNNKNNGGYMFSYWGRNEFYRAENKLHIKGWYNDTIYTYNSNSKFTAKYFIDLKEYKIPEDLIPERMSQRPLDKTYYWVALNESKNYIFIRYGAHVDLNAIKSEEGCVIYNKTTNEGTALKNKDDAYGFVNDFNGGPPFKPRFSNDTLAFVNVSALDMMLYLDSEEFKNMEVKFPEKKNELGQINKTLNENDNDFLILVKLKK